MDNKSEIWKLCNNRCKHIHHKWERTCISFDCGEVEILFGGLLVWMKPLTLTISIVFLQLTVFFSSRGKICYAEV